MKFIFFALLFVCLDTFGQHSLTILVKDSLTNAPLAESSVSLNNKSIKSDSSGLAVWYNLPNGKHRLTISHVGYAEKQLEIQVSEANNIIVTVFLLTEEANLDEVIIESTRLNKSIKRVPTRVETLTDEIDEAASMEPSRIAHLITHSTGIQVQTTSASSNGAVVRIQGLNGRYTKMLKDGFPLFGGFLGSLDVTQIPPLDLRQVEYIKGSASTLYGGGAIAGIVNLLSKKANKEEVLLHLNRSTIGSNDLNAFVAKPFGKWGVTILSSYQLHNAYDADDDDFSDLPQVSKFNFNPKVFFRPSGTTDLYFGAVISKELRRGGDIQRIKNTVFGPLHFYLDMQQSTRATTQFKFQTKLTDRSFITVKNSVSLFDRYLNITENSLGDNAVFGGDQVSTFSELSYNTSFSRHALVLGTNFISDVFKEDRLNTSAFPVRNEHHITGGLFINHVWDVCSILSLESGIRTEWNRNKTNYTSDNGELFILPRVSALIKYNSKFTSRIGGGLGYRPLTIFNEEAEPYGYKAIQPVNFHDVKPERSYGLNADVSYQSHPGNNMLLTINHMFYYNSVSDPVTFQPNTTGGYFTNSSTNIESRGFETQVKFTFGKFTWFIGYTFTDAYYKNKSFREELILVPKHSIKGDLLFVDEGRWRIAADYEFKSGQKLSDGRSTRDLFTTGAIVERTFGNFVIFFNAENITDVRQTKYESLRSGPYNTPQFTEVWAPLEGRFFNLGLKLKI